MSTLETLRQAARRARQQGTASIGLGSDFNDPRHMAVADWLDDLANRIVLSRRLRHEDEERHALTVAAAYLGESS